jgi:hypothetical protein
MVVGSRDYKGTEKSTYPVVLFRKNGSDWKVSNAMLLGTDKYDKSGKLILHKSLTYPPMFSVPPDFTDLFK